MANYMPPSLQPLGKSAPPFYKPNQISGLLDGVNRFWKKSCDYVQLRRVTAGGNDLSSATLYIIITLAKIDCASTTASAYA